MKIIWLFVIRVLLVYCQNAGIGLTHTGTVGNVNIQNPVNTGLPTVKPSGVIGTNENGFNLPTVAPAPAVTPIPQVPEIPTFAPLNLSNLPTFGTIPLFNFSFPTFATFAPLNLANLPTVAPFNFSSFQLPTFQPMNLSNLPTVSPFNFSLAAMPTFAPFNFSMPELPTYTPLNLSNLPTFAPFNLSNLPTVAPLNFSMPSMPTFAPFNFSMAAMPTIAPFNFSNVPTMTPFNFSFAALPTFAPFNLSNFPTFASLPPLNLSFPGGPTVGPFNPNQQSTVSPTTAPAGFAAGIHVNVSATLPPPSSQRRSMDVVRSNLSPIEALAAEGASGLPTEASGLEEEAEVENGSGSPSIEAVSQNATGGAPIPAIATLPEGSGLPIDASGLEKEAEAEDGSGVEGSGELDTSIMGIVPLSNISPLGLLANQGSSVSAGGSITPNATLPGIASIAESDDQEKNGEEILPSASTPSISGLDPIQLLANQGVSGASIPASATLPSSPSISDNDAILSLGNQLAGEAAGLTMPTIPGVPPIAGNEAPSSAEDQEGGSELKDSTHPGLLPASENEILSVIGANGLSTAGGSTLPGLGSILLGGSTISPPLSSAPIGSTIQSSLSSVGSVSIGSPSPSVLPVSVGSTSQPLLPSGSLGSSASPSIIPALVGSTVPSLLPSASIGSPSPSPLPTGSSGSTTPSTLPSGSATDSKCGTSTCKPSEVCATPLDGSPTCIKRVQDKRYCSDKPCRNGMNCFDNTTSSIYTCYSGTLDGSEGECLNVKCPIGHVCYQEDGVPPSCIPLKKAPKCTGTNEEYRSCSSGCDATCEDPSPACQNSTTCTSGCGCIRGYVRIDGECELMSMCNSETVGDITCDGTEMYTECMPACELTCKGSRTKCPPTTKMCQPGCTCRPGYHRDDNGQCVHVRSCFSSTTCDENEHWSQCYNCEKVCGSETNPDCSECYSGCGCKPGFSRTLQGKCVKTC